MEDILSRVGIGSSFLISFFNEGGKDWVRKRFFGFGAKMKSISGVSRDTSRRLRIVLPENAPPATAARPLRRVSSINSARLMVFSA